MNESDFIHRKIGVRWRNSIERDVFKRCVLVTTDA